MTEDPEDEAAADADEGAAEGETQTAPGSYNGFAWRSRFLRSPKIGADVAAREDFVEVREVARVTLGAKTGCDDFFFVRHDGALQGARRPVVGLGGWSGAIPRADLLPAVKTIKDLDFERGGKRERRAAVPVRPEWFYLSVRPSRVDRVVREYVDFAEQQGIQNRDLVQDNAEDEEHWYRQVRGRVTSQWALPYNSGYDYGAADNSVGAVLNGRLVGVDPLDRIDPILLGAALNSTFTVVTRLMEGVATGNEGAYDVSPPSVRVMRIPDPRKMTGDAVKRVRDAMSAIAEDGALPPAPDRNGNVSSLRRNLDMAVLQALGVDDAEAAVLLDRVYRDYGRWRAAVEDVEDRMQEHRRALTRRGGDRRASPTARAARTVLDEMRPTLPELLPGLLDNAPTPDQFVDPVIPPDALTDQEALFGEAIILDGAGAPLDLGSRERLQLAARLRAIGMTGPLPLPLDPTVCQRLRLESEAAERAVAEEATRRAEAHVSGEDLVERVASLVTRRWTSEQIGELSVATRERAEPSTNAGADQAAPSLFDTTGLVPDPPRSSPSV